MDHLHPEKNIHPLLFSMINVKITFLTRHIKSYIVVFDY